MFWTFAGFLMAVALILKGIFSLNILNNHPDDVYAVVIVVFFAMGYLERINIEIYNLNNKTK